MRANQTSKITVAVRKRPLNRKQLQKNETDIVRVSHPGQVVISQYKQKVDLTKYLEETTFNFDNAYDQGSANEQIYEQSVRPLIENAFKGAKISCFAYGQTGSGKTYTMKGDFARGVPGVYYLGAKDIFNFLQKPQHQSKDITVTFYEIYCGKLHDLLNQRSVLQIREDKKGNINVIGLNEKTICSAQQFMSIIEEGSALRITSQNNSNNQSSRSHAILQIIIKEKKSVFTKISFIDLAGNERGADHMDQNKQTKIDGAEINKSLLCLKECIRALDQGKGHTPFRGSKLTMVLKDSFIGFCQTVMICNISPNNSSSENTMNTLRYADRVKELKGKDDGEKLSKEQLHERQMMLPRANKNIVKVSIDKGDDQEDIMMKMEMARQKQENPQSYQRVEEKMEVQQPVRPYGRKNDVSDRRTTGKDIRRGNQVRGREIGSEQPLRNNNLNMANGYSNNDPKGKLYQAPQPPMALNRSHYEAMNNMRNDFQQYQEEHERIMNDQMKQLKEEYAMWNDYKNFGPTQHYEEQIDNVDHYLNEMERIIREKDDMVNMMKDNYQRMRTEARNAQIVTAQLRQEQEQSSKQPRQQVNLFSNNMAPQGIVGSKSGSRIHVHSNPNGMNFNGFNGGSMADEQLLEGLGEETRLF